MKIHKLYKINIYERYKELKNAGKTNDTLDNYDLSKIFEWYSCIYLYQQCKKLFYEYSDIDPTFKEINNMTKNDTGIDCCDLIDTIVQCKLRKDTLDWKECGTFFGSQNIYSEELNKIIVRWNNLIITRNEECKLSKNLLEKSKLFTDISFPRQNIIDYCEALLIKPPKYPKQENQGFELRDYQVEAINLIRENNINTIISLPTGCGKNVVIIYSMKKNKKYLILVPRIILMEQLMNEIIRHKPEFKNNIQCIGDNNNDYDETKNICICVYNSVSLIEPYFESFTKIYIDEAHHIDKPMIYDIEEEIIEENDNNEQQEIDSDYDSDEDEQVIELVDDVEDEIKETTGYHNIIKSLSQYNNNVYLSATIDEMKDFTYYKKDIRDMIEHNYLCDYNIHIPIFNDDPTNKNICEHLINNYMNIIIYCNSQKEGKAINELMNRIQKGCSMYIDCMTSKSKRNEIVKKYKEGTIPFLVNVRILVEGFDAPITKGICFMHLPSSKTTLIQIIGRALRLHPLKTIAHIILPFSCKEDESNINNFLKVMANNDKRIKQSYENKKIGGYISIENTIEDVEEENTEKELVLFRYNMIFDNMGKLLNGEEIWMKRLEEVKKYIDDNGKRPAITNKDKNIKQLGQWISTQTKNYKIKSQIMSNVSIYSTWKQFINYDKYKKYFMSNEEIWMKRLEEVKEYIDKNQKRPSNKDKNLNVKQLGQWIYSQTHNYKTKEDIMSDNIIYNVWTDFINSDKYQKHFISDKDRWYNNIKLVKQYIDKNGIKPSTIDENIEVKQLGQWISNQTHKIKKDSLSDNTIYNTWEQFINHGKYKKHFISNKEVWYENMVLVQQYIDKYNKRPSSVNKDENIKQLGKWISTQIINYKNKRQSMTNVNYYNTWKQFINSDKYKKYFISNMDQWYENMKLVQQYIDKYNKRPSSINKDKNIKKLGQWIYSQIENYKNKEYIMKNKEIYDKWTEFINDPKYKKFFEKDNDE
jgi:superfamily II DNA or RNA helicase